MREPAFARKYLKRSDQSFSVSRGLSYAGGSLDLVATAHGGKVLYGEVKNWGASTWRSAANRRKVLDQLRLHDQGIADHLAQTGRSTPEVAGRVLFVAADGFRGGVQGANLRRFEQQLETSGWTIEYIPSKRIGTFGEFIDDLR